MVCCILRCVNLTEQWDAQLDFDEYARIRYASQLNRYLLTKVSGKEVLCGAYGCGPTMKGGTHKT